jgi:phosphatidylglycerophosphatase A
VNRPQRPHFRLLLDPAHLLALGFGAGLSPRAPGTAGSLLALPFAWLMWDWPLSLRIGVVVAVIGIGIIACDVSSRRLGVHDHPAIVLDEIAAMLLVALACARHPAWLLAAFVLFRLFDITKPWPIRDMDHRLKGGLGIMLDDLMAALYAMACLWLLQNIVTAL